jgi:hypothetical protein
VRHVPGVRTWAQAPSAWGDSGGYAGLGPAGPNSGGLPASAGTSAGKSGHGWPGCLASRGRPRKELRTGHHARSLRRRLRLSRMPARASAGEVGPSRRASPRGGRGTLIVHKPQPRSTSELARVQHLRRRLPQSCFTQKRAVRRSARASRARPAARQYGRRRRPASPSSPVEEKFLPFSGVVKAGSCAVDGFSGVLVPGPVVV